MTHDAKHADIIERNVEKTNLWLNDLANVLETDDRQVAYRVPRAFLHAVRDRLTVDEALGRYVGLRALPAHVVVTRDTNPRIERPAHAACQVDLTGPVVGGHVDDVEMRNAIDALANMEHQLRRFDRHREDERGPTQRRAGEWRHGDPSLPRTRRRPPPEPD
jgi:ribosome-associated translation inhibitor RaiA